MTDTDIAIVGAGAAGLAAATELGRRGVRHVVLEAGTRSGGRAWTDETTFPGLPFDRGCHWLHAAEINPLRTAADRLGVAYDADATFLTRALYRGSRRASERELAAHRAEFETVLSELAVAGVAGTADCAALEAVKTRGPTFPLIARTYANITSGDLDEVSVVDGARYHETGGDYPVAQGYGALILALARGTEVQHATPVTRIDWSSGRAGGVRLDTVRGTLTARAVIVTASTSVLADGAIRFTPELPVEIAEALDACRIGFTEKIALRLDRPLEEFPAGSFFAFMDEPNAAGEPPLEPLSFYANPFGRPLLIGHVGGGFGRTLMGSGAAAAIDFATAVLVRCFGSAFRRRVTGATVTGWGADPYIRGGYSFARPGKADLRWRLETPIGERIFLAGEAVSHKFFSTAHGAHLTGIVAAERAVAAL